VIGKASLLIVAVGIFLMAFAPAATAKLPVPDCGLVPCVTIPDGADPNTLQCTQTTFVPPIGVGVTCTISGGGVTWFAALCQYCMPMDTVRCYESVDGVYCSSEMVWVEIPIK
jgi:hypothetical protein